jgi:hypothetical protein
MLASWFPSCYEYAKDKWNSLVKFEEIEYTYIGIISLHIKPLNI